MFVLPAEYGVDPLGTGARFGLLDLGVTGQQVKRSRSSGGDRTPARRPIIVPQDAPFKRRRWSSRSRRARGWNTEYRLDKGEALLYSWRRPAR